MSFGFILVLLVALLLGVAAVWLIWRARLPAGIAGRLDKLFAPLSQLSGAAEARYRTPWVLLLGEHGAGKSSFTASIPSWLGQAAPAHRLTASGTQWCYCNRGVLIDPDSGLPDAVPGSTAAGKWQTALNAIRRLRPERPLDGVVLFVSARTLQGDSGAIQAQADAAWQQLCQLQATFEFSLPVYVVVSQCDALSGFAPFWHTQDAVYREEMFGWSAPAASESGSPAQWSAATLLSVTRSLETLQLRTEGDPAGQAADQATTGQNAADNDGFFLFPRQLLKLQDALTQWLETAFRSSAWQAGFTCRGIYFTGSIEAAGVITPKPRKDLAFVADLVNDKILAERWLATPSRQSIWSRDRLIRSLQISGIALIAALSLGLAAASLGLYRQTHALTHGVSELQHVASQVAADRCAGKEAVFRLLAGTAQLDGTLPMPQALLDHRIPDRAAELVGADVFQRAVLPSLACHLDQRAQNLRQAGDTLPGSPLPGVYPYQQYQRALFSQIAAVRQLEENVARYQALAQPGSARSASARAHDFALLLSYAYGVPEKEVAAYRKGLFDDVLASLDHVPALKQIALARPGYAQQITQLGNGLSKQLYDEVVVGSSLIDNLNHNREPILQQARHLAWWLNWTRDSWLSMDANPCLTNATGLQEGIAQLQQFSTAYTSLGKLPQQFDASHCATRAFQSLDTLKLAPYGQVFVQANGVRTLNPALAPELSGLNSMLNLGFMQLDPVRPFACISPMAGWREDALGQASGFIGQYQRFIKQQNLPALGGNAMSRPLYQRIALSQLERALNSTMNDAQVSQAGLSTLPAVSNIPVSDDDAELAQESSSFARTVTPLLSIRDTYTQLGFAASNTSLTTCMRQMASGRLAAVDALADDSQLYDPSTPLGQTAFFSPAGTPAINDYLNRQAERSQVLVGYASPFVTLLRNTGGVNDGNAANNQMVDYWANTIGTLNRFVQAKDRSGSMGQLDSLLVNINGMTEQNCRSLLQANPLGASSNDLFYTRRDYLLGQVSSRCSGYAQASAQDSWQDFTRRFRKDLAGRYPFGPLSSSDADPLKVRQFFADYNTSSAMLRSAAAALPGSNAGSANAFLDQLDDWNAFFRTTLAAPGDMQPVHVVLTFRAQPDYSHGTEQIVSWALTSGTRMAGFPNQPTTLDWPYGQMTVLDLNWADHSLWQPGSDVQQRDLQVQQRSASFVALGNWALLRLIDRHAPTSALPAGAAGKGVLLEFNVPVSTAPVGKGSQQQDVARGYLGMLLQGTDPASKALQTLSKPATAPYAAPPYKPVVSTVPASTPTNKPAAKPASGAAAKTNGA
ncbi:hypothetical protein IGB42_00379 [Andreprevotia sp. IGB-42]|uniref:type VI secretion system protein n=1 Tax=Andreprevotia sp. IGB-42 TaxID=2497473 RepID=UPI00135B550B|nr:type VI secretion protein IcmF/TssM N-terminal domain-containing protein [Andreprevotia sp. IGB-42]KAF0815298.1 hypothetical protein IGB42_00379 [Andreprevotia sp. IGB-42]